MRKAYLDNIRWGTVVLVLVYHVAYLFNGVGVPGGVGGDKAIPAFDVFASAVYPWFMVLLFLVAGISARYALDRQTPRQFLRARCVKLLVPSTLGLFALHWVTGYLNVRQGGALEFIPAAIRYPIYAVSGTGVLWFAQTLFLYSALLVLVRRLDRGDRLWALCGRAKLPAVLLLGLVLWGGAQLLNPPIITVYRFGIYGVAFFAGYLVFSHDRVQELVERVRVPLLLSAVVLGVLFAWRSFGADYSDPARLQAFLTNAYAWVASLAVLGCGKAWLGRTSRFTAYMTRASFGLYVLHYPVLLWAAYALYTFCALPPILNYLLTLCAGLVLTPLFYELVRRIPVARFLVLGMGRGDKNRAARASSAQI